MNNAPKPPDNAAGTDSRKNLARQRNDRQHTGYVGSHVCAECHVKVAHDYHLSPMSRSFTKVDAALPADLLHSARVDDPHSPYSYQVQVQNSQLFQEETVRGDGKKHQLRRQAAYFVGSGNHARAMLAESNGYLTQLPLAFFSHSGTWRLNPGYELKNRRFDRPILPGCVACHGGFAKHRSATRNRYHLPVSNGISCEHCHGPGERHVAFRNGSAADKASGESDPIVNPKRLSPQRANDVCLQCHLQGDVVVYQPGADPFSYRPGEKLSSHRLDFLIQTDKPEAFGVASHGARMMRSRCHIESGGKLTCIHCHDAHRPAAAIQPQTYDSKCVTCHTVQSCSRPAKKGKPKASTGCVACHMPRRKTREGQHLVFTDHRIRRPPQKETTAAVPPLLSPNSEVKLIGFWPNADLQKARLGSAYVKLHESMGPQLPALKRGLQLLEGALRRTPDDTKARYWLASGEIARYRGRVAVTHLLRLLETKPGWPQARFRLAIAYHQMEQYRKAIAEYERVIRENPDWMEPYPLVVRLHLTNRNADAALRLLKQQLSFRDDATANVNVALARHVKEQPLKDCLPAIDRALRLNPRFPTAYVTRAYLYAKAGRVAEARRDYKKALSIDPQNREAQAGLQALPIRR